MKVVPVAGERGTRLSDESPVRSVVIDRVRGELRTGDAPGASPRRRQAEDEVARAGSELDLAGYDA